MSEVRMCDGCGNLFSVNEQGWEQYTKHIDRQGQTQQSYDRFGYPNMAEAANGVSYNNPVNHGAATFHTCRQCLLGDAPVVRPRVMLAELPSGRITSSQKNVTDAEMLEE